MQALAVDNSAVYFKLIGDHLRSWDFGVTLAETGSETWLILEQPDAPFHRGRQTYGGEGARGQKLGSRD